MELKELDFHHKNNDHSFKRKGLVFFLKIIKILKFLIITCIFKLEFIYQLT